jgi:K319-like protein
MKSPLSIMVVLLKDRNPLMELTRIISSPLLVFLLIFFSTTYLLSNSDGHAFAIPFSRPNERGFPSIPTNDGSLNRGVLQPHASGTPPDLRQNSGFSAPVGANPTLTNCASPNPKLPNYNTRNCVGPNSGRPATPPNIVETQPSNCNTSPITTTSPRHNSGQSNVVVRPNNCLNTTVVNPTNCNIPTVVRHTNSSSNTFIRPSDCPSTSTSNSLTVNKIQGTASTVQNTNTNTGLYGYLYPEISQNGIIIPVANPGANQVVPSYSYVTLDGSNSYDPNGGSLSFSWMQAGGNPVTLSSSTAVNPAFIAPIVIYPTTLTFQLTVNNGVASSVPSYVYITVQPY